MLPALAAHCRELPPVNPRFVGIYFLLHKGALVYIGQSTDIESRIANHQARKNHRNPSRRIKWDSAVWMEVAEADLGAYEGALIRCLRPKYNRIAPTGDMRDEAILAALGLPAVEPEYVGKYFVKDEAKVLRNIKRNAAQARRWKRERARAAKLAAGVVS